LVLFQFRVLFCIARGYLVKSLFKKFQPRLNSTEKKRRTVLPWLWLAGIWGPGWAGLSGHHQRTCPRPGRNREAGMGERGLWRQGASELAQTGLEKSPQRISLPSA
jgi:hypothetical protein